MSKPVMLGFGCKQEAMTVRQAGTSNLHCGARALKPILFPKLRIYLAVVEDDGPTVDVFTVSCGEPRDIVLGAVRVILSDGGKDEKLERVCEGIRINYPGHAQGRHTRGYEWATDPSEEQKRPLLSKISLIWPHNKYLAFFMLFFLRHLALQKGSFRLSHSRERQHPGQIPPPPAVFYPGVHPSYGLPTSHKFIRI